jgi:hypothetical protein
MRRSIIGGAMVAAMLVLTAPAGAATSYRPDCSSKLIRSAVHQRSVVVKRHGNDAAGRDIIKWGRIGADQHAHRASCSTVRRYRDQLIQLRTQPKHYPLVVRTAVTPYRAPAGVKTPSVAAPVGGTLQAIRQCESGGNYSTNTGNGFAGAYQFTQSTWASVGGSGSPAAASPAEQDKRAAMLYAREGSAPWPVCGR